MEQSRCFSVYIPEFARKFTGFPSFVIQPLRPVEKQAPRLAQPGNSREAAGRVTGGARIPLRAGSFALRRDTFSFRRHQLERKNMLRVTLFTASFQVETD
jgi:hypothetical protein